MGRERKPGDDERQSAAPATGGAAAVNRNAATTIAGACASRIMGAAHETATTPAASTSQ